MSSLNLAFKTLYYAALGFIGAAGYTLTNDEIEINNANVQEQTTIQTSIEDTISSTIKYNDALPNFDAAHIEFDTKKIPVIMLHNIHEQENRYTISPNNFRKLLEDLNNNNFYSVTLEEYTTGNFSRLPIGAKPMLITADDASTGQFMLNNDGSICSNSLVGIIEDHYTERGIKNYVTFFVSPGEKNKFQEPFMQDGLAHKKMNMLLDLGHNIGFHTDDHANNTNATKNNIYKQYIVSKALLNYYIGEERFKDIDIKAYAHPYGATPKNREVADSLHSFYDVTFLAWGGPSHHPLSINYDPHAITRIELTYQTRHLVLNARNTYKVTPETKKYYEYMNLDKDTFYVQTLPNMPLKQLKTNNNIFNP